MEEKDLKQIEKLFEKGFAEGFKQAFASVWEHNLEPALNEIHREIAGVKSQMVTKSYLDDKIANLQGDLITKLRKEDDKLNRLADILRQKKVISDSDIQELGNLVVFPK
ncbi:MAG: hypothetical protein HY395_00230 [Candidatus Doudnabacteria bacterium]|nr:hypothetical protein [Candidatus Doudnabacteria bacterium]